MAFRDISDEFTTPCFSSTLNDIKNGSADVYIVSILNTIFGSSDKMDVIFQDGNLPPGTDGTTKGTFSGGYVKEFITLNTTSLKNATKEYIAATIAHEILHGYFDAKGTSPLSDQNYLQHQQMAGYYVEQLTTSLTKLYPTMSINDAEALAWGGLGKSIAWQTLASTNPQKAKAIVDINNAYRSGKTGTKCN